MGYSRELSNLGINTRGLTSGQHKVDCPKPVHGTRGGRGDLSINIDDGTYKCHSEKCGWSGSVAQNRFKKTYTLPEYKNVTSLSDRWVKWFSARGIGQATLSEMKISDKGDWALFPFFENDVCVNIQARTEDKKFKMVSGSELTFYNLPALYKYDKIIICEGMMDCLSYIEAGIPNVISVPNGASVGNMEYLGREWQRIEQLSAVYISVDNDAPGIELKKELIRRIGPDKCWIIDLKDTKDANEYIVGYGTTSLKEQYDKATPCPVEGIVFVADETNDTHRIYHEGLKQGSLTGIPELDEIISYEGGYKTIVTGAPSDGKSEYLDFVSTCLAVNDDWIFGVFSPENFPHAYHISKLASKVIGKPFYGANRMSEEELYEAEVWINQHFIFIDPPENFTIDNILEKARIMVVRYGINGLILDPYNKMEHHLEGQDKETDYVSKFLDKIDSFNKKYKVHTFLVCHPRKLQKQLGSKKYEVATLYDIAGSHHFYDKADIGESVYRDREMNETQIHIQKRRFKHWGKKEIEEYVVLHYNYDNGRFFIDVPDNTNWLRDGRPKIEKDIPI